MREYLRRLFRRTPEPEIEVFMIDTNMIPLPIMEVLDIINREIAREQQRARVRRLSRSFNDMSERLHRALGPTTLEVNSRMRYARAVEYERLIGLAFVRAEAARVRRELGLPPG